MVSQVQPEPAARVQFEVTGANVTEIRARANDTAASFADNRPFSLDIDACPCVSTNDGQIVRWRGEITATIYPQETR